MTMSNVEEKERTMVSAQTEISPAMNYSTSCTGTTRHCTNTPN